ncbi:MAG: D-alanyl-lipoteichoic acid biosynthesis protein DltD [Acidimicrobiales bacterium]
MPTGPAAPSTPSRPAPTRSWPRTALKGVAIVVVVLLVGELLTRALAPQLVPESWGVRNVSEASIKRDQLAAASAAGRPPQVLFVGDSTMDAGVSPTAFADASRSFRSGYDAALLGARLPSQRLWVERFVLPEVTPRLVVQGVTPLLVSTLGASPADTSSYDATLSRHLANLDPDLWQQLDETAGEHLALVRYRSSLRSPRLVAEAAWNRVTGAPDRPVVERRDDLAAGKTAPDGQSLTYVDKTPEKTGLEPLFAAVNQSLDGRTDFGAMDAILATYRAQGLPVVVVIPPVATELMAAGGVDVAAWREAAHRIADQARLRQVPVLDYTDHGYPTSLFGDVMHLNGQGSQRFSADLAADLDGLCARGELPDCRPAGAR